MRHFTSAAAAFFITSFCVLQSAHAADPLGLYIGAAYGEAHIRAAPISAPNGFGGTVLIGGTDFTHSAYQIMLGVRPVSFLGAEITYMDLGQHAWPSPPAGVLFKNGQVSQKGEGAFAVLYLPVPLITVYLKAGLSRLTIDRSADYEYFGVDNCAFTPCRYLSLARNSATNGFAAGAGVQWRLGSWTFRGEYERFNAAGSDPSLISFGAIWSLP
ncbi:MAG TPA: outer membrane beta-barrel protein [Steroidobacteraceae bacterium]|nr:outer membrane beta-barrel protein [Steroidobacteraceae bacterium]